NTLAQTVMAIDFTASNSTVVILFGGRIAAKKDWGSGTTASGVATSPYNLRLLEVDGRSFNQSCSLTGAAVVAPPLCDVFGAEQLCPKTTNTYSGVTDTSTVTYTWSLLQNTAGATIVDTNGTASVKVRSGDSGGTFI